MVPRRSEHMVRSIWFVCGMNFLVPSMSLVPTYYIVYLLRGLLVHRRRGSYPAEAIMRLSGGG